MRLRDSLRVGRAFWRLFASPTWERRVSTNWSLIHSLLCVSIEIVSALFLSSSSSSSSSSPLLLLLLLLLLPRPPLSLSCRSVLFLEDLLNADDWFASIPWGQGGVGVVGGGQNDCWNCELWSRGVCFGFGVLLIVVKWNEMRASNSTPADVDGA